MVFDTYSYNRETETIIYTITQKIYDKDAWIKNHKSDISYLKNVIKKLKSELGTEINLYIEFNTPVINIITDIESDNIDNLHKASKEIKNCINNYFGYPTIVYRNSNCTFLHFDTEVDN